MAIWWPRAVLFWGFPLPAGRRILARFSSAAGLQTNIENIMVKATVTGVKGR